MEKYKKETYPKTTKIKQKVIDSVKPEKPFFSK